MLLTRAYMWPLCATVDRGHGLFETSRLIGLTSRMVGIEGGVSHSLRLRQTTTLRVASAMLRRHNDIESEQPREGIVRRILSVATVAALLSMLVAAPALAEGAVPNEGASGLKSIEVVYDAGPLECPSGDTLSGTVSGYYMSRWDTLAGQIYAVENVNIDWTFTNDQGEAWTYMERGVSIVREAGEDLFVVANNGSHNHFLFGAHIGHRVFTATEGGATHLDEIVEAGRSLDHVLDQACAELTS